MDAKELTQREQEVIAAIEGKTIEEAAKSLSRSQHTIKSHLLSIRRKGFRLRMVYCTPHPKG